MSTEPIASGQDFADALTDVVTRYMQHLEPSAEAQSYAVKMDVTGERLNITFAKSPNESPYISFTLASDFKGDAETVTSRGLFGR